MPERTGPAAAPGRGPATGLLLTVTLALLLGCTGGPGERASLPATSGTPAGTDRAGAAAGRSPSPSPSRERTQSSAPAESATPRLSRAQQVALNRRLVAAAWEDDVERARRLVERGADVNWRDQTLQSAHLVAASEGHLRLLELTLDHGADVRVHDSFDGTGLIRAAERGHWHIVGRLLRTPTDPDHVNNLGWVALHEAIILGDGSPDYATTVRALVAGGAGLRIPSARDGLTPLEHARAAGQDEVVATLTAALAADRVRDPDGLLLRAAADGDADEAAVALRAGARLEARDHRRRTPLLRAVLGGHPGVVRLLRCLGADPRIPDRDGLTALEHARRRGFTAVARSLVRADG